MLARDPENPAAKLIAGQLDQARGDLAAAEAAYRAVIAAVPGHPAAYQALFGLLAAQGRAEEAEAALEAGLAAVPDNGELIFARAGMREGKGDIDGAIADYELLYARDSSSPVLANNLASLLASYRDDPASLDRAFAIARRLKDTDVPYFQDTYGWILHRRGDDVQALTYLEPAAAALPDMALVQFHLGEAQFALGRREAARASYEKALAAAEGGSPLPRPEAVRARIAEIDGATPAGDQPVPGGAPEEEPGGASGGVPGKG